jgi:hypothetical protein
MALRDLLRNPFHAETVRVAVLEDGIVLRCMLEKDGVGLLGSVVLRLERGAFQLRVQSLGAGPHKDEMSGLVLE